MEPWYQFGVVEAQGCIRRGDLSPVTLLESCLDRIDRLDPEIRAWVSLDRDGARRTAEERAAEARRGAFRGPLHGIPVGLKDIYHVAGMVTTNGAGAFAHESPRSDAEAVVRLRAAGAVVIGKTTTTEFAYLDPTPTRNPWNPGHTPGGSSSGSAAAVGARMVPLALGSQTVGSTLRPAAYCGAVGFKPTYGRISTAGMTPLAWSFDHVGIFCRQVEDTAAVLQVLAGYDPADPASRALAVPDFTSAASRDPQAPRLGLPRRLLERATPEVVAHLEATVDGFRRAGAAVEDLDLPSLLDGLHAAGMLVVQAEAAASHAKRFVGHASEYQEKFRSLLGAGMRMPAVEYVSARRQCRLFRRRLEELMPRFDALLMPVASAPAPAGLASTGDPFFCAPWTFAGVPAIALPSGLASGGLPLGIQLVGAPFEEGALLATARWCERVLAFEAEPGLQRD